MPDQYLPDMTDFFSIDCGDEVRIGGRCYRITGHEKERRFGIDDPKFWVKRAVDTESGERKIIKFAFFETFYTTLGGVEIKCFRDPEKEGKILELVRDHPLFMQGESYPDGKNNTIRVLDIVQGSNFYVKTGGSNMDHRTYFSTRLPDILKRLIPSFEAIGMLHRAGFRHGDIRNDHIIVENDTGNYVWIDFDYDYLAPENPFSLDLFGLGNVVLYAVGKGAHDLYAIASDERYKELLDRLDVNDFSILDKTRFMNLKKLYPYIPDSLNNILMHFSKGTQIFYENVDELLEDLNMAVADLCQP